MITKFYRRIAEISRKNLQDTTSLADSRRMQNAIKYFLKVRKWGAAGNESNILARITKFYTDIRADLLPQLLPVGIYRSSKKTVEKNAASNGFGSNFSSEPIDGLLVALFLSTSCIRRHPSSFVVVIHHKVSGSNNFRTV